MDTEIFLSSFCQLSADGSLNVIKMAALKVKKEKTFSNLIVIEVVVDKKKLCEGIEI